MVAFTFVVKKEGKSWSAQRVKDEEGPELTAEADDTYSLQKELLQLALAEASGPYRVSFSTVSPTSAVYQVVIGGAVAAGGGGSGGGGGGGAAAAEAKEEEKPAEEEEEEDEDMGFSLFD
ncbi:hypothetical protein COCSUDRAFT_67960 [Coccomyxa subellipsoidea C-169]|uniref:Ribosomal protein 60S n=1 Tax=Coccomyxa subellipsoidea (strain C-169) TaxID=574566 RepID=I0YL12_COCSC|nr:hypothetical protein COCSUDRAFT_67960 [Coccomyxa subellipsoidea C-169]EIE19081.1 hypothetical protein COCSUDRAFT_67960 [Coccomyxa subellipsoidea C-169]|eukprot:XP_005643625.1 hypothetical protein COCSUDRAFT_67960 [Coccomyxa subellipsoidea C-169]